MIFGHFIYFGHFPIEIPIEAEKYYHHGKELSYRENKMCSETSEAVGTIWEHAQKEFQKFLKIRITLVCYAPPPSPMGYIGYLTNMNTKSNSLNPNKNHSNPAQKMLKPAEKAQTFTQMLTTSQSPATGESKAQG